MIAEKYKVPPNKSNNRVLVLERIPGEHAKNSKGMVDNRLFTGENSLHLYKDKNTRMWHLRYKNGVNHFKGSHTSFEKGIEWAKLYFAGRGFRIAKVID